MRAFKLFPLFRPTLLVPVAAAATALLVAGCNRAPQGYPVSVHVKPLTQAAFASEVTQAKTPVVVDFYATWCGPCKIQAPVLEKLAEEYEGKVKFLQVDVDQEGALASQFEVEAIPTLLVFNEGKVVQKYVGLTPADELKARLETLSGPTVTAPEPAPAAN